TPCANQLNRSLNFDLDRDSTMILDHNPSGQTPDNAQVFATARRVEIGIRRRPAPAPMNGLLHRAEAFLLMAIIVGGDRKARLAASFDEGGEQRIVAPAALDMERTVGAAPAGFALGGVLHADEVGQHVGMGPAAGAEL